ncbi:aluminum-activated malate transporter 1-like [Dioscorea cayenensis subsp. rotundata]|uniref:Aluminum-activated malate transporter 1-like n=1 Tax=Dioscorea cayennensis subsp. rotundata TaxID=55577 RepID=A0AB40AR14_DIOCR|nr:aluminum-activated malate transporter 1-like [Dioscorea cayenensis subsp. rotundata]
MISMEEAQQSTSCQKIGFSPWWMFTFFITILKKLHAKVARLFTKLKKIAEDDPRRVYHSFKVGLALTLVSIFYYVTPLFNGFGSSCMWAVLTVVVVMEFTVGATLGKGLNRTLATVLAGSLALGAHHLADLCGEKMEPILLGILVFILASAATFSRFIPRVKKRYDYGVTIFILTFSLVAVSSYRVDEVIPLAHQRASTIAVGVATCLCTTFFVFPVWAGEDLHKLTATNLEKLACFLQGLGDDYFQDKAKKENKVGEKKDYFQSYKSVLNSKPTEESLANFAKWEPGHNGFGFRHPWNQYLKIGASTRRCAYSTEALSAFLTACDSKPKPDPNDEVRTKIRSACAEMSSESAKALSDLASSIRTMSAPTLARQHMAAASAAAEKLKAVLLNDSGSVAEIVHVATIGAILVEIVNCEHEIVGTVEELARLAGFRRAEAVNEAPVKPGNEEQCPSVVITIV